MGLPSVCVLGFRGQGASLSICEYISLTATNIHVIHLIFICINVNLSKSLVLCKYLCIDYDVLRFIKWNWWKNCRTRQGKWTACSLSLWFDRREFLRVTAVNASGFLCIIVSTHTVSHEQWIWQGNKVTKIQCFFHFKEEEIWVIELFRKCCNLPVTLISPILISHS